MQEINLVSYGKKIIISVEKIQNSVQKNLQIANRVDLTFSRYIDTHSNAALFSIKTSFQETKNMIYLKY